MKIVLEHVTFAYDEAETVLHDISLTIEAGEAVAIIGENGAGKTTLVKHIKGLLKPDKGTVTVGEWDTGQKTVAQLAAHVGYVFQNPDDQLFERKVHKEIAFGPRNLGLPAAEVETRVNNALDRVGLRSLANSHPYDLHIAHRKLVALAAALAMNPPIYILDEPTSTHDAAGLEQLGQIIRQMQSDGHTVITITHDMEFCAAHFDRVIVMASGQIIADGPTADILAQADRLAQAGLEPPQLIRLAQALNWSTTPLTIEDFLDHLK